MTRVKGNTYPVKDQLKALGGRWDAGQKAWMIPDQRAAEAQAVVSSAPKGFVPSSSYRPRKCVACGHVEQRQGSHGQYPDPDKILRSGECVSCYEERKMGY